MAERIQDFWCRPLTDLTSPGSLVGVRLVGLPWRLLCEKLCWAPVPMLQYLREKIVTLVLDHFDDWARVPDLPEDLDDEVYGFGRDGQKKNE